MERRRGGYELEGGGVVGLMENDAPVCLSAGQSWSPARTRGTGMRGSSSTEDPTRASAFTPDPHASRASANDV